MTPVAARVPARRRAARCCLQRGMPPLSLALLLVLCALLSPPRGAAAQGANCSALSCPYECDAGSGCYDECTDRKGWTLAAQRDTDVYDLACTRRDVRDALL
jgi:hypothetical protein